ncbi:MAG: hypothetical protein NTY45_01610 [Elusimicrobia bacterium]|nr:hypothetical protein [Elusimicrobiota bacterium]
MNEAELAEKFNKELDGIFRCEEARFTPDPEALEFAAALARADFSADSAIKAELRERLAGARAAGGFAETLRALLRHSYAAPALAAACLLLILLPLTLRRGDTPAAPAIVTAQLTAPQARPPAPPAAAPAAARRETETGGLFGSVPMASLTSEPIRNFPIKKAGGSPIAVAKGREVKLKKGTGVVWETESGTYMYERRVITPDDIFERKVI